MIGGIPGLLMVVLTGVAFTTVLHALVVIVVLSLRRPAAARSSPELSAVTWFRPLKSDVRDLRTKLTGFAKSVRAGDQVLLGVEAGSEAAQIARDTAGEFSGAAIVIECRNGAAKNPKVSKLFQMAPSARHEHWIIADGEAIIDPVFAAAFQSEWRQTKADVITAGYRFTGTDSWPQRLDAMATVLTLWPGLEWVRMFGKVEFTLGACTGVRRADVEAIGGFAALGDELAEDYWLGARLCCLGRAARLSDSIITLDADAMIWREYWRHQIRVAATYRGVRPLGAAGMILTRGVTASLLVCLVHPLPGVLLLIITLVTRVALAECVATVRGYPLRSAAALVLMSDAVETAAWLRAWFSRSVWWGGRARRITWRARLKE